MSGLILGIVALAGALWLLKSFTQASPSAMSQVVRRLGGYAAMGAAALLLVRGRIDFAIPLFIFGAGLAGWMPGLQGLLGGSRGASRASSGRTTKVRSRLLVMELDHDSGGLRGQATGGRFAGRMLDDLSPDDLGAFYRETASDPDSRSLLEAYLDRRAPGWREHFQKDAATGAGERARRGSAMTKEEAHQILGVEAGAGADEIRRAHRTLMKKLHPDQGGSTYLAARVNEARDVLLGSHR